MSRGFIINNLVESQSHAVWVSRGDSPPTVVRQSRYASKTFFSIFFKSNGPLLIHHIERGQTIDHQYYINNCLRPLINEIKRQRPAYGTTCSRRCNPLSLIGRSYNNTTSTLLSRFITV